ncbi:MAG TPA: ParA family protein [Microvirga sp.]|jgi:chromosome partitioning protein|nr:ParA family protein [Microvirga sp.]
MNVLVLASRKGGSGKSTLAAHLASQIAKPNRPTLLIDADPQGSLSLWHELRGCENPVLRKGSRNMAEVVKAAGRGGCEWTLIDTPPNVSAAVIEALRLATLVIIPARPGLFDLAAVHDTIELCRELKKPFCVVMNGAPPKRGEREATVVKQAREGLNDDLIPVWSGQITHRADFSLALSHGEGAKEYDAGSQAAAEMAALWSAVDRSVKAINSASKGAKGMHKLAA